MLTVCSAFFTEPFQIGNKVMSTVCNKVPSHTKCDVLRSEERPEEICPEMTVF